VVVAGGAAVGLLGQRPSVTGPLDPNDPGPAGVHALAALLTARGQSVLRAGNVPAATALAGGNDTTMVVTSPGGLSGAQLSALSHVRADLLVVAPGSAALDALAPGTTLAGQVAVAAVAPGCGLAAARLAGRAELGGMLYTTTAPAPSGCYYAGTQGTPGGPHTTPASLVSYRHAGHLVTLLGTGVPLSNGHLSQQGDAALAMDLLSARRIVWLVPTRTPAAVAAPGQPRSLLSLIPWPAYLVAADMGVVVLLAAAWRARRFGPLVAEPLPVAIHSSETVAGHGRLYRSRHARDRAAGALRTATLARLAARLGQPQPVDPATVCQEVAARTGRDTGEVRETLFGAVPANDGALLRLANDLDSLEGQVLSQ
jgi:hypothetical protein